jgi:hypothetical protein
MAACITLAGESLIAQKQSALGVLDIRSFVLANIPNLDPTSPIDRAAGLPPAAQIVGTWAYTQKGFVDPNRVVYSLMLGSDVGDFDWNWIGLTTAEGTLFAVSTVPVQQKRRTIQPIQTGNNVTRNIMVAFDGAQELTAITVEASTWQHDFTELLRAKEPAIPVGKNTDFWSGNKSWADLASAVRGVVLSGLSTASATAVAATDTLLSAIGKLQAQITSLGNDKLDKTATAASATKLATARKINGLDFDGSGDISISAPANGGTSAACTGNAATATRLATARTINGVSFNGTANITISAAATAASVLAANAGAAVGAVGTYALLNHNVSKDLAPGASVAGSSLFYANVEGRPYDLTRTSPGGTWRCMGRTRRYLGDDTQTTLFLRIS